MIMRFVIDETSWKFDHMSLDGCCRALDQLMDQIELASKQNHGVCYSEELFCQFIWKDKTFYDLLAADSGFTIPHELNERLSSLIYALPKWQDFTTPTPDTDQVHVDGQPQCAASIAWAHQQTRTGKNNAIACLIIKPIRNAGCHQFTVADHITPLWLVADQDSYQEFFRWMITETSKNAGELAQFSQSAFPHLEFREGVFDGIAKMSKSYAALLGDLVRHLAALSDHGLAIFTQPWDQVPARFGQYRVDLSPESGNTKGNKAAVKQRTFPHGGKEFVFLWHTKLEPHQDRIHFYPNDVKTNGRILIGIFCKHLDT